LPCGTHGYPVIPHVLPLTGTDPASPRSKTALDTITLGTIIILEEIEMSKLLQTVHALCSAALDFNNVNAMVALPLDLGPSMVDGHRLHVQVE
jgi:hypothetical protein